DYQARMYDPVLRRFLSPDPAHQYASPYLFVGNDPMTMVDPSGNISVYAQVGIGAGMVAMIILGMVVIPLTLGAAAPEVAAGEAALGGALAAGEAAAVGAAEGAAVGAGSAGAAGAVEGAAAGAGIAAGIAAEAEGAGAIAGVAGAAAVEAATASSTIAANLGNLAIQGVSGAFS